MEDPEAQVTDVAGGCADVGKASKGHCGQNFFLSLGSGGLQQEKTQIISHGYLHKLETQTGLAPEDKRNEQQEL